MSRQPTVRSKTLDSLNLLVNVASVWHSDFVIVIRQNGANMKSELMKRNISQIDRNISQIVKQERACKCHQNVNRFSE